MFNEWSRRMDEEARELLTVQGVQLEPIRNRLSTAGNTGGHNER
jgi:hypothetical protein